MPLKNIDPTKTKAWKKLLNHFDQIKEVHLKDMFFNDKSRKETFSVQFDDVYINYSNNRITQKTLDLLIELAQEVELKDAITKYFLVDKINVTENKAVLHTALRSKFTENIVVDSKNVIPKIKSALQKIKCFSEKVISGTWKGYTGKSITDVVNIGIGGSHLGPNMVVEALQFYKNHLNTHFVSNVDGDHLSEILKKINPETTLFIIVSKTFTTQETITNANTIKNWFLKKATQFDIEKHFIAVSTNKEAVDNFGIDKNNIFPIWSWISGRFSLWSSVGLSVSLSIGFDNFQLLLQGAQQMDTHFKTENFNQNIPVILALLSIWYTNFFNAQTQAVFCYSQYLKIFVPYLQQISMESNGKNIDRNGVLINYQTSPIVWGGVGTDAQHAVMQLLHQGTQCIPTDFIGFENSLYNLPDHHKKLMANYNAQIEALALGKTIEEAHLELKCNQKNDQISQLLPFKTFQGNKPSTSILLKKMTPTSLGKLIALYEHKIFVQGVIWNIFSYDQFGVELGKELTDRILKK